MRSCILYIALLVLAGCISDPPSVAPTVDSGSADAAAPDSAGADIGPDVTVGCTEPCDDQNPCTDDSCINGQCSFAANTSTCDDGNPCTVGDTCADGGCRGTAVQCDRENTFCDNGQCVCAPGFTACQDVCIPMGSCCNSDDCAAGATCPGPGGSCGCTPENPVACGEAECFPAGTCCDDSTCTGGQECVDAPGGTCECPDGQELCNGTCIDENSCCDDNDCSENLACINGTCQCQPNTQKLCEGRCIAASACCTDQDCTGPGQICDNTNQCACPSGWQSCSGGCFPTCCPGPTGMSCPGRGCDIQICNTNGDGFFCRALQTSNCTSNQDCNQDCSSGFRRCQADSNDTSFPFRCACSGCF